MRGKIVVGRKGKSIPGYSNVYIGRGSPFGNPFVMRGEDTRNKVCTQYEKYFSREVRKPGELRRATAELYRRVRSGEDVYLQCFCAPRQCHGDTIKNWLEHWLTQEETSA